MKDKDIKAYSKYKVDTESAKNKRGKDLTGQKLNKLTILKRAGSTRNGGKLWLCQCECGVEKSYSSDHLTRKIRPVQSCGCVKKGSTNALWTGVGDMSGGWWADHVVRSANGSKGRKPLEFTLTKQEAWDLFLKQNRKCALSGVDLEINSQNKYNTASVDRINSSKGYVLSNIQWVHKHVNLMKNKFDQEYFIDFCKKIALCEL